MTVRVFKKTTVGIILATVVVSSFTPGVLVIRDAQAQGRSLGEIAANTVVCAAFPFVESALDGVLGGFRNLIGRIPGLGAFIGSALGADKVPVHVTQDDPSDIDEAKDCVAAALKRGLIRAAVNDILEWAREDFDGKPRFVTDFKGELVEAADRAGALFARDLTNANICQPFRTSLEILIKRQLGSGSTRGITDLEDRISCTLSEAVETQTEQFERFKEDFSGGGGWKYWIRVNESQNTLLGAYLIADDERIELISQEVRAKELETETGRGFQSEKVCVEAFVTRQSGVGPVDTLESVPDLRVGSAEWEQFVSSKIAAGAIDVVCAREEVVTPAATISDKVSQAVGAELDNLVNSEQWQGILREVFSALITDILENGL